MKLPGKKHPIVLDRRTLLRGAGAVMALPWLEAMLPRCLAASPVEGNAGEPPAPLRTAILYMPNGVNIRNWKPEGNGPEFELSPTLAPLASLKDQLTVLTRLRNTAGLLGDGHYAKTTSWLTGATAVRTGGKNLRAGISIDQKIAQAIGHHTPLPSLELGVDPVHTVVDMGYSTVYGCHVSWRTPTLPATKEIDPKTTFDRLFRTASLGQTPEDQSVLDLVRSDAKQLRQRIGGADRQKLDEYLDSVRAIETRIERLSQDRTAGSARPERTFDTAPWEDLPDRPPTYQDHVRLMLDILVLAFQTDTTRVASFMFGNDVSGRNFSFVDGVSGGFHPLSHHENNESNLEQYFRINRWHIEQVAYLAERMRAIREGERTLLDQSLVLFGSSISDGNAHSPFDVPTVVLGSAGGRFKAGQHIRLEHPAPLCNLFLSILDIHGIPADSFGDSTARLTQVFS